MDRGFWVACVRRRTSRLRRGVSCHIARRVAVGTACLPRPRERGWRDRRIRMPHLHINRRHPHTLTDPNPCCPCCPALQAMSLRFSYSSPCTPTRTCELAVVGAPPPAVVAEPTAPGQPRLATGVHAAIRVLKQKAAPNTDPAAYATRRVFATAAVSDAHAVACELEGLFVAPACAKSEGRQVRTSWIEGSGCISSHLLSRSRRSSAITNLPSRSSYHLYSALPL